MTIVTLVHGTWARKAKWTAKDSPLADAIRKEFPGEVNIVALPWSGRNRHFARKACARKLAEHVQAVKNEFPGSDHFIVSHSHGGNAVLYALTDPAVDESVSGLVFLSTPFISCRKRVQTGFPFFVVYAVFGFVVGVLTFAAYSMSDMSLLAIIGFALSLCLLAIGLTFILVRLFFGRVVYGRWRPPVDVFASSIAEHFELASVPKEKALILRTPGDEASAALAISQLSMWLSGVLTNQFAIVQKIGHWFMSLPARYIKQRNCGCLVLFSGFGIVCIVTGFMVAFGQGTAEFAEKTFLVAVFSLLFFFLFHLFFVTTVTILGGAVQFMYALGCLPLVAAATIATIPFGLDVALLTPWCSFSVETSPPGEFTVLNVADETAPGLAHSRSHSDPNAIEHAVQWMKRRSDQLRTDSE